MTNKLNKVKRFCINEEFFLIDCNNIDSLKEEIYGYAITEKGIIDRTNLNNENVKYIDGCGAYIYT